MKNFFKLILIVAIFNGCGEDRAGNPDSDGDGINDLYNVIDNRLDIDRERWIS